MQNQTYEVEIRGLLDQDKYKNLLDYLNTHAKVLGPDDRETVFFIIPDKTLKVTKNISKETAKIALKLGNIKTGKQEEIEIPLAIEQFKNTVKFLQNLGFTETQYTSQKRANYEYKGFLISVKHSDDWGYHFEIDTNVSNEKLIPETRVNLERIAKELGLKVMTEEEIRKFCEEIDKKHKEKNNKANNP